LSQRLILEENIEAGMKSRNAGAPNRLTRTRALSRRRGPRHGCCPPGLRPRIRQQARQPLGLTTRQSLQHVAEVTPGLDAQRLAGLRRQRTIATSRSEATTTETEPDDETAAGAQESPRPTSPRKMRRTPRATGTELPRGKPFPLDKLFQERSHRPRGFGPEQVAGTSAAGDGGVCSVKCYQREKVRAESIRKSSQNLQEHSGLPVGEKSLLKFTLDSREM
jgi:hypothetical protein